MSKETSCCFTGHRILGSDFDKNVLRRGIDYAISQGIDIFICGGATGFDTVAATAVLEAKVDFPNIQLHIYAPCNDQSNSWSKQDRQIYKDILKKADFVSMPPVPYYDGCMKDRNYKMVDNSVMCIAYMNSPRTGTGQTYRYAVKQGLTVYNIAGKR